MKKQDTLIKVLVLTVVANMGASLIGVCLNAYWFQVATLLLTAIPVFLLFKRINTEE